MFSQATPTLVTGALGNVGCEVVVDLIAADAPVRAADLDEMAVVIALATRSTLPRLTFLTPQRVRRSRGCSECS